MHRNSDIGASSQNLTTPFASATSISHETGVLHYRMTFAAYI